MQSVSIVDASEFCANKTITHNRSGNITNLKHYKATIIMYVGSKRALVK